MEHAPARGRALVAADDRDDERRHARSDDVEQRVVISLWKQLEGEQSIHYPSSYIYRAAVRETVRAIREMVSAAAEPVEDRVLGTLIGSDDPHRMLESKESKSFIDACIDEMETSRQRAVRSHLAGFEVTEIMEMYGWSYNKARNLIARGMAELRQSIRERERP